jgi:putative colanic acid biosynthesis UDP-glucose lipid carrier transferase
LNSSWIFLSWLGGLYSEKNIIHFEKFCRKSLHIGLAWTLSLFVFTTLSLPGHFPLYFITILIFSFSLGLLFDRFLYVGLKYFFSFKLKWKNRILIIGYNDLAIRLSMYFEEESINNELVGYIEDINKVSEITHYPIFSPNSNLIEIAINHKVNEIYSTISPEQHKELYSLINLAEDNCIRFKLVPDLSTFLVNPVLLEVIKDIPILTVRKEPLDNTFNVINKRIVDIFISVFAIIFILSWLIPLIGILIIIDSKGPILYRQKRSGRNNNEFFCLKFRTMKQNNQADEIQATKNDHRITRFGRFLRKTSLDEFPQFLNVFMGDMSVVGPRPHMLKHTIEYSKIVDHFMLRHFLKPGITGWAQINGLRGEIKNNIQIKQRILSDIWYYENWNIWLDLKIIFFTIFKIFKGDKNAY